MADLFLSYAKANREQALLLAAELRDRGFSVWVDQGGIGGAKNWSAEIVEAINACSTMLVLLSPQSIASGNVVKEVQLASQKGRNILPIVLERVALPAALEYPLVGLQHVYFQDRASIWNALDLLKEAVTRGTDVLPANAGRSALSRGPDVSSAAIRIAVLPFDDLSPQHDNQWFADGMMDELISTLGGIEHIKIPPRSDVLHYRDHKKKSREVAQELGVRYLIEGGVRKAQEKIRINALVVDTMAGEQLWSQKFDGTFEDVFAFQELVSKHIVDALKLKLTPEEEKQIEDRGTDNAEAYELYLKGRHEQYYYNKESYLRALELYEQAAKHDPNYAKTYIGIASVCFVYYREYSKNLKWLNKASESLEKVLNISGETSHTLMIRGMIEWMLERYDNAVELLIQSSNSDPKNYNALNLLGNLYLIQHDYSAAAKAFRRVTELTESTMGYYNLLAALHLAHYHQELTETAIQALPVFDRYLLREPNDQNVAISRGFILAWANRREEAMNVAETLSECEGLSGYSLYNLGCLYDQLGNAEQFILLLKKAIESGFRDIEQFRNYRFLKSNLILESEVNKLIWELEKIIRDEK